MSDIAQDQSNPNATRPLAVAVPLPLPLPLPLHPPRRSTGRILRRGVFVVLLCLAVFWVVIGWNWLGGVRHQLAGGRALDRARTYSPPTTQHVVYDEDPRTYPLLLARGARGGYVSAFRTIGGNQYAGYDNPDWSNWLQTVSHYSRTAPICFLHELTSRNGTRRVVAVQISSMKSDPFHRLFFGPDLMDTPPTPTPRPPTVPLPLVLYRASGAIVRVYDGQTDANDRSRFVFVVEHNGQKIDVGGQLGDDGKIVLTPAAGQVDDFISELAWLPPGVTPSPQYMNRVRSMQMLAARQSPIRPTTAVTTIPSTR